MRAGPLEPQSVPREDDRRHADATGDVPLSRLRAAFEEGQSALGAPGVSWEAFAAHALAIVRRWLERQGVGSSTEDPEVVLLRMHLTDLHHAFACDQGSARAIELFLERYRMRLVALLRSSGSSGNEAAELMLDLPGDLSSPPPQAGARTRFGTYEGFASLFSWLSIIVLRRRSDRRRAHAGRTMREISFSEHGSPRALEEISTRLLDPYEAAVGREVGRRLVSAMGAAWSGLTAREQLVLLYKFRDGLPQQAIARLLGIGDPRVSRLLDRSIEKLRSAAQHSLRGEMSMRGDVSEGLWVRLQEALAGYLQAIPPAQIDSPVEDASHEG